MNRPTQSRPSVRRRRGEMAVFIGASTVGTYAIGNAFHDLSGSAAVISLGWFALTGVALLILIAQMSRVHEAWPRRPGEQRPAGKRRRSTTAAAKARVAPQGERE